MARPWGKTLVIGSAAVVMAAAIGYFVVALMEAGKPPTAPTVHPASTTAKPAPQTPQPAPDSGPNQSG